MRRDAHVSSFKRTDIGISERGNESTSARSLRRRKRLLAPMSSSPDWLNRLACLARRSSSSFASVAGRQRRQLHGARQARETDDCRVPEGNLFVTRSVWSQVWASARNHVRQ